MPSNYPGGLDSLSITHADGIGEVIHASTTNDLADAVNKIEAELGVDPAGTNLTVAERLDDLLDYIDTVASGGVELDYVERTTPVSTTNTALTDISGLSVTVSTSLRPIVVRFQADYIRSTATFLGGVILNIDGTDAGVMCQAGSVHAPAHGERRLSPGIGTHTYKLRTSQGSAGTLDIAGGDASTGTGSSPMFLQVVEV